MKTILFFPAAFLCGSSYLFAQINIMPSVPYTQDFNSLISSGNQSWTDNSTLAGWYADENTLYADDGNDVFGGRLHSYGSVSSTERALGGKSFSSLTGLAFAVRMKNNSNSAIGYFQVSFTGEQWRQNSNNLTLKFYYQVNATAIGTGTWTPVASLDFPAILVGSAMALDGNLAQNQTAISDIVNVTVNALDEIWFKWEIIGNSNSPGLAIDDLTITPYVNNPTSVSALQPEEQMQVFCSADLINVKYFSGTGENIKLSIVDASGRNLHNAGLYAQPGANRFAFPSGNFSRGIYFILLESNSAIYQRKLAVY